MILLVGTVAGAGTIIWVLSKEPSENASAFITATIGLVTTLLGLPLIIAQYLFNKEEDESITGQMFTLQENDRKEREANTVAQRKEKSDDMPEILKAKPPVAEGSEDVPGAKKGKPQGKDSFLSKALKKQPPTEDT